MNHVLVKGSPSSRYRPQSVGDRRNYLLDVDSCSREARACMDEALRGAALCVPDDELPALDPDVISALVRNADVPHTVISMATAGSPQVTQA